MRRFLKKISHPFLKFGLNLYYSKPRKYTFEDVFAMVHPDVFPPQLTLSTKILLNYINSFHLKNKTFLELGCGSGVISLLAAKKGAIVTATDINNIALEYLKKNAADNKLHISIQNSDLFDNVIQNFDFIIINPPYYPKTPKNIKEQAWFCGENFEYFEKLFQQLPNFINKENEVYMILSEDCKIEKIKTIASKNEIVFDLVYEKKIASEKNYIFRLRNL